MLGWYLQRECERVCKYWRSWGRYRVETFCRLQGEFVNERRGSEEHGSIDLVYEVGVKEERRNTTKSTYLYRNHMEAKPIAQAHLLHNTINMHSTYRIVCKTCKRVSLVLLWHVSV